MSCLSRGAAEWSDKLAFNCVRVRPIRLDAEFKHLGVRRRDIQGAEQPVPHRKTASQVLVEVIGIARVMNLVMRRTHQQTAQPPGERYPKLRVLQMDIKVDEEYQDEIVLRQAILMRRLAEGVVADAICEPGEDGEDIEEYAHIDRVDAKIRQRRKHCR
jgi:hypothetical protein